MWNLSREDTKATTIAPGEAEKAKPPSADDEMRAFLGGTSEEVSVRDKKSKAKDVEAVALATSEGTVSSSE